ALHQPRHRPPRHAAALPAGGRRWVGREGVRERRAAAAHGCDGRRRGADRVPLLVGAHRVRPHQPHDRVLPVHRHPRGHLLRVDADGHERVVGVLDHDRRAVRRVEVVPRARGEPSGAVAVPGCELLQAPAVRARVALGGQGLDERQGARAHLLAVAVGHLPGRRRPRAVRVPRGPRRLRLRREPSPPLSACSPPVSVMAHGQHEDAQSAGVAVAAAEPASGARNRRSIHSHTSTPVATVTATEPIVVSAMPRAALPSTCPTVRAVPKMSPVSAPTVAESTAEITSPTAIPNPVTWPGRPTPCARSTKKLMRHPASTKTAPTIAKPSVTPPSAAGSMRPSVEFASPAASPPLTMLATTTTSVRMTVLRYQTASGTASSTAPSVTSGSEMAPEMIAPRRALRRC